MTMRIDASNFLNEDLMVTLDIGSAMINGLKIGGLRYWVFHDQCTKYFDGGIRY